MPRPPSPSRRRFLGATVRAAAAFAAPAIVPASVLGPRAPGNRINVGMIGLGRQARRPNLPQLLALPDVQVVAACDVDAWRLEEGRRAVESFYGSRAGRDGWTGCAAFRDFRDLLARPEVDAVMISTPDHWHVPMGILAARAGKHVSVEKPLSTSIAEGRALCEAVARHRVVGRTDSEFRSLEPFRRAAALVRHGRIGRLHTIRAGAPPDSPPVPPQPTMPVPEGLDYDLWLGPAPEAPYTERRVHAPRDVKSRPGWMRVSDYTNGMISNWGTHLLDIAQWANGTERTGPVEVVGTGEFSRGLWDTITAFEVRYAYANGVRLVYRIDRPYVRFEGTGGWVEAGYPDALSAGPESLLREAIEPDAATLAARRSDKEDWVHAIRNGGETLEPIEVGHRTASVCQLGLIAVTLGGRLRFDPDRETFPDDNAASARLALPRRSPWGV